MSHATTFTWGAGARSIVKRCWGYSGPCCGTELQHILFGQPEGLAGNVAAERPAAPEPRWPRGQSQQRDTRQRKDGALGRA
eukprot:14709362-Alexandrium_andersonii.AAC.1